VAIRAAPSIAQPMVPTAQATTPTLAQPTNQATQAAAPAVRRNIPAPVPVPSDEMLMAANRAATQATPQPAQPADGRRVSIASLATAAAMADIATPNTMANDVAANADSVANKGRGTNATNTDSAAPTATNTINQVLQTMCHGMLATPSNGEPTADMAGAHDMGLADQDEDVEMEGARGEASAPADGPVEASGGDTAP
ncbi:hypothetical protein H4R19_006131, partial [Coemansia spiralis]